MICFVFILLFYRGPGDSSETGKEPFTHRSERVGGHQVLIESRIAGRGVEAEEVFDGGQIRCFYTGR